jgi:predicted SnoaL-like aldol condensation-catalyzing enzyme
MDAALARLASKTSLCPCSNGFVNIRFQFWCFGYCGRLRRAGKFIGKSPDFPLPAADLAPCALVGSRCFLQQPITQVSVTGWKLRSSHFPHGAIEMKIRLYASLLALLLVFPAACAFAQTAVTANPNHQQLLQASDARTTANKRLVYDFWRTVFEAGHTEYAPMYMAQDYIQHNPGVQQGRQGIMDGFREKFKSEPTFKLEIKMMIAEDDMVAVYLKNVDPEGNTKARVVDIYRLEDGKLAEHWDVLMPCK